MDATNAGTHGQRPSICSDDRAVARLLQVNLERQGWSVACAFDWKGALQSIVTDEAAGIRFDRVVLDQNLPGVTWQEAVATIRTQQLYKLWIAVMLDRDQPSPYDGRDEDAPDRYLVKPFDPKDAIA